METTSSPAVHPDGEQTRPLQPTGQAPALEDLELRRAQGLALCDHLEQTPLFPAEADKATLDQFH
jgi:glutathione S-transferase